MKRINVIGTSGSGKSTFSRMLATTLGYPYIEMDAMFWQPNWQESSNDDEYIYDWHYAGGRVVVKRLHKNSEHWSQKITRSLARFIKQ